MNKTVRFALVAVLLGALLAAGYFWWQSQEAAAPAVPVATAPVPTVAPAPPPAPSEPVIKHPLETEPASEPLPSIDASDDPLTRALAALVGSKPWQTLFHPDQIIRRIVATIDNLPRQEAPVKMWPVKPVGSPFMAAGSGATLAIDPANAKRYAVYTKLAEAVDAVQLVALYRRYYPLFQQAYVDLGFPQGYFNDRLVVAIDDLLAAPEPAEPPRLTQPKVLYQFADADMEKLSAGQKIMLRIGTDNARRVKTKLREIRKLVAKL
jgi:hypothetical protein